jgi:hypothetical protein
MRPRVKQKAERWKGLTALKMKNDCPIPRSILKILGMTGTQEQ